MNDVSRDKYEILDLVFTFFHSLCMILTAFFLLSNLIVSLLYTIIVVLFVLVVLFMWKSQNQFTVYLIRALSFNNLFFSLIALIIFYSLLSPFNYFPVGYDLLLFPSIIYLIFSLKFPTLSPRRDKRAGAMLAYTGRTKAARNLFFQDNPEERRRREELIAKQKKEYKFKRIIALILVLTLSSFTALAFGFS